MKKIITILLVSVPAVNYAQPKMFSQAIISTTTTIVSPEQDESPANNPGVGPGGEEMRIIRDGGEGETRTTTWLKGDKVKTFSESEMGRTTIIRDNGKKMTTTLMEMMGKKTGFYVTDSDQVLIRKKMDSMMQDRRPNGLQESSGTAVSFEIANVNETKKISGFTCRKAIIITTRSNGKKDSSQVWYTPDLKLLGVNSTGGSFAGFGGISPQASTMGTMFDKLDGFPIQYERNMNRGRKMMVLVTKITTEKEITEKEF